MLGSGGLQTTANVQIKVGVQRQPSFAAFERQFAAFKQSLNQVGTISGLSQSVAAAAAQARQLHSTQQKANIQTAAQGVRVNQQANAQIMVQNGKAAAAKITADARVAVANTRLQAAQLKAQTTGTAAAARQAAAAQRVVDKAVAQQIRADERVKAAQQKLETWRDKNANDHLMQLKKEKDAQDKLVNDHLVQVKREGAVEDALANGHLVQIKREVDARKKAFFAMLQQARDARDKGKANAIDVNSNKQMQAFVLSRIDAGNSRLKQRASSLRVFTAMLQPAINRTGEFKKAVQALTLAEDENDRHNKRMRSSIGYRLDQTEKQFDAVFRAAFRLQMVGQNLQQIGRRIAQGIMGIMDTFGEFQYTMNRAAGALQIWDRQGTETKVGIDDLQESLLGLSRESRLLPAKDVAEAMYFWASATGEVVNSQEDLRRNMQALKPIMQASMMTNTSYEATIKGVYSIISQYYNGNIQVATHVTELLFYATQKTALEFTDLIQSFKMIGPISKANNVSFEDMVGVLGRLGDLGIRGTMAGRALRQMLIQLVRPSKIAQKALDTLFLGLVGTKDKIQKQVLGGKSYAELVFPKGTFVGIERYIDILAAATLRLNQVDRNFYLSRISTANELPVLTALVRQAQKDMLGYSDAEKKFRLDSKKAHDYFIQNWTLLANSWKGILGGLQRSWEHLQIQLGSTLADVLNPILTRVTDIVESIRQWARANPGLVATIGKIASGLAILTGGAGILIGMIGSVLAIGTGIALIGKVIAPWALRVAGFTTALGLLFLSIGKNAGYIQKKLQEAQRIIEDAFASSGASVETFGGVVEDVMNSVGSIMDGVVRTIADLTVPFAYLIKEIINANKTFPILKTLGMLIGVLLAYKTIGGIISLTKAFGMLNLGMIGLGGNSAFGKAFTANKLRTAALGIGGITKQVSALKAGFRGLLSAIDPFSLAIGIGFVAYETNTLGLRDAVDHLALSFKNMGGEVKTAADEFGGMNREILELAQKAFPALTSASYDALMATRLNSPSIKTNIMDPLQFTSLLDAVSVAWDMTPAGRAGKEGEKLAEQQKFLTDIQGRIGKINSIMQGMGLEEVTLEKYAQRFVKVADHVQNLDFAKSLVDTVMSLGPTSRPKLLELFNGLKALYGPAMGDLTAETLADIFFSNIDFSKSTIDLSQQANDKIYKPVTDAMQKALTEGNAELAAKIYQTPLVSQTGFTFTPHASLMAMLDKMGADGLTQDEKDLVSSLLAQFPDELQKYLAEHANDTNESLVAGIKNSLEGAIQSQMTMIEDVWGSEHKKYFDDLSNLIANSDLSGTIGGGNKALDKVFQMLFVDKQFDGGTAYDAVISQGMEGKVDEILGGFIQWLTDNSGLDPKYAAAIEAIGKEASADPAANYLAGLVSGLADRFSSKNIKAAMAKGSDIKQIGFNIRSFMDKTIAKALALKHPNSETRQLLEARDKAFEDLLNNAHEVHPGKWFGKHLISTINRERNRDLRIPGLTPAQKAQITSDATRRKRQIDEAYHLGIYGKMTAPKGGFKKGQKGIWEKMKKSSGGDWHNWVKGITGGVKVPTPPAVVIPAPIYTAPDPTPITNTVVTITDSLATLPTAALATGALIATNMTTGLTTGKGATMETVKTVILDLKATLDEVADHATATGAHISGNLSLAIHGPGKNSSGYLVGQAWGRGFNKGLFDAMLGGLKIVGTMTIGGSPPKAGPLKDIDKGGRNIGTAWGEAFAHGSHKSTMLGLSKTQRAIRLENLAPDAHMSYKSENEKRIKIDVDIKSSDGTANRKTQSEIRASAIKALSLDAVAHLAQVG